MSTLKKIETFCDNCQKPFILVIYSSDLADAHFCPFCGEDAFEADSGDEDE